MQTKLYDAHVHLADPALAPHRAQINRDLEAINLTRAVVNGTSPADWPKVLSLAKTDPRSIPAIGLHPWQVNHAPADWKAQFLNALENGARAIGEIGLDQWIKHHDIKRQQDAFCFQLAEATQRNLPVSIHCLKAIEPLMKTLRTVPLPSRGIHIHAYGGPLELIPQLLKLGATFSFNSGQLRPDRPGVAKRIRAVPIDRILIETDAPSFLPQIEHREFHLPTSSDGRELSHPANLRASYEAIAKIRELSVEALAVQLEANFIHYFAESL